MRSTYHTWQRLVFNYVVQVVNSQRGHYTAIILLHRRSGRHRHSLGIVRTRKRSENGEMCEKFSQITYCSRDKSILYFIVHVYYMVILSEMLNVSLFRSVLLPNQNKHPQIRLTFNCTTCTVLYSTLLLHVQLLIFQLTIIIK